MVKGYDSPWTMWKCTHCTFAAKHKGRSGSSTHETSHVFVEEQKMSQCCKLAHPCSLDDLIAFNDVGKIDGLMTQ